MKTANSKITVLDTNVSRKIAAGEVIDRPFSVLRELVDNSIDAAATEIDCRIEDGGSTLIQVLDNGSGMNNADLRLCWLSHATSKITNETDLLHIRSLGFRGEALSSIAAVSRLEILSKDNASTEGLKLTIEGDNNPHFSKTSANQGTRVRVRDLFFNLPARKKFIKSPRGETTLCRNIFIEKAVAHPTIGFKFFSGQKKAILLPPHKKDDYLTRIAEIYRDQCPKELLHQIVGSGEGFSFRVIIGLPPLQRSDRKYIHIYCNRRRIHEFSLVHAVEYAFSAILPGGTYPVAFVFLDIDPADIDFNIHPAKKEIRFKNPDAVHRRLRESIQEFIEFYSRHSPGTEQSHSTDSPDKDTPSFWHKDQMFQESPPPNTLHYAPQPPSDTPADMSVVNSAIPHYRYLGQIFSVFLLTEIAEELYIIDMHAAHERILFDRYRSNKDSENLLIPICILGEERKDRLKEMSEALNTMGFKSTIDSDKNLLISAVPTALRKKERLLETIISDIVGTVGDLETALYEKMACRTAVKDGDILDSDTACRIIEESWQLPIKRCPHGRPIWFKLSKKELFQLIGRIV